MKRHIKGWIFGFGALALAGWLIWSNIQAPTQPAPQNPEPVVATPPPVPVAKVAIPIAPPAEPPKTESPKKVTVAPPPVRSELEATHQMLMAHSVLREPRIADPNSSENRVILQTMLAKALMPPSPTASR